jgi:hypothetical protein
MTERTLWLPVLTAYPCCAQANWHPPRRGVASTGSVRPGAINGPNAAARRLDATSFLPGNSNGCSAFAGVHGHHLRPQGSLPLAIWPYEPYIDTL